MSISFAGSRCVDERRRRRLAQEADLEPQPQPERRGPVRSRAAGSSREIEERRPAASPAESIVRPQLWAHVLISMLTLGAGAAVLTGGDWIDRMRPELASAFGLQAGRLAWLFPVACLLFAAQLAYINLWYRVRSRKDFSGRYRVWYFVVPAWLVFSACVATDGHHLAARAANARWPLPFQSAELLWWMAPAGVVLVTFARMLSHEMRRTTGGMLFLWTATIIALVDAAILLGRPMLAESHVVPLIEQGCALLWPASLMLSMMYFARYVIHVSSEPSEASSEEEIADHETEARPGFFSRWSESRRAAQAQRAELKAKLAEEKVQRAAEKTAARAAARKKSEEVAEAKKAAAKKPVKAAKKPEPVQSKKPVNPPAAEAAAERPASTKSAKPARRDGPSQPTPAAKVTRTDPPETADEAHGAEDDESLQGLSKKERRRLRKIRRQRASAKAG